MADKTDKELVRWYQRNLKVGTMILTLGSDYKEDAYREGFLVGIRNYKIGGHGQKNRNNDVFPESFSKHLFSICTNLQATSNLLGRFTYNPEITWHSFGHYDYRYEFAPPTLELIGSGIDKHHLKYLPGYPRGTVFEFEQGLFLKFPKEKL